MSGEYLRIRRKTQWIGLLDAEQVLGGDGVSIEFWLRIPALPEGRVTHLLGTSHIGTPNSFTIGLTAEGKVYVGHGSEGFDSRTGIVPGVWTHVAYQYDFSNGMARILLNGVADRDAFVKVTDPAGGLLSLGDGRQRAGFGVVHYDITDLRFWSQFRSDAEIRGSMERRVWEPIHGLSSLWPLVEGVGLADPIIGLEASTDGGSVVWGGDDGPPSQLDDRAELPVFGERSWIQLPGRAERLSTKAYTVEAWVAPELLDRAVYWSPAVGHSGDRTGWELRAGSHRCSMVVTVDHRWVELEWQPPHPSTDWFHVAGVVDQHMVSLLVNGIPVVSRPISGRLTPHEPDKPVGIGRNFVWTGRGFRGAMQEVRLWNGARTVAQIQQGRHRRATGSEPDLVAVVPLTNWGIELVDRATHLLVGGPEFRARTSPPLDETAEPPATPVEIDPQAEQERLRRQLEESERRSAKLELELASQKQRFDERLERLLAQQQGADEPPTEPEPQPPARELEPGETTLDALIRRTQAQIDAARDALRNGGASYELRDVSMELRVIPAAGGETIIIPTKAELGRLSGDGLSRLRLDFASDDLVPVVEPTMVEVPDVRGYTEVLARRRLNEVGLITNVVVQALSSGDQSGNGRVVTQLPEPADEVTLQSPVTIFIGRVAESEE